MSSSSSSSGKLPIALHWTAIFAVLIIVTWSAVIFWWQVTQRIVTPADTLVYLIVLPLFLLLCFIVFRWRARRQRPRTVASSDSFLATTVPSLQADNDGSANASALPILATWTATSLGASRDEFIEALTERRSRPTPDELLMDDNGFPALSARARDIDTVSIEQILLRARINNPLENSLNAEDWRDAAIRAFALLESVLDQVQQEWPLVYDSMDGRNTAQSVTMPILRGSVGLPTVSARSFRLQIKLLVAADFAVCEKQLAHAILASHLTMLGKAGQDLEIEVICTADDASTLALIEEFRATAIHDDTPQALLLLACDSLLCTTTIEMLESQGRLFDARHPNGLMVGEAAFGVLFANYSALRAATVEPICHLTRVLRSQREQSADIHTKTSPLCLANTVQALLQASGIVANNIGTVVCDADHRTSRVLECIETMMTHTPQLDAIQNRLATNEVCGHLGMASVLGLVSTGVIQSVNAGHPVLLFNVGHATERAAAIIVPANHYNAETDPQHLQAA